MAKQFSGVAEFVRVLAQADKAGAAALQAALSEVRHLEDLPPAIGAFERAGLVHVQSGHWDGRTLIVRKSNFRKVAETACTHPEFRKRLAQRPVALQRAYFMALEATKPSPQADGEETIQYRLVRLHRLLNRAYRFADTAGFGTEARAIGRTLKMLERMAEEHGAEEVTREGPTPVRSRRAA